MAAALIDRLLHHCHIFNIRGNSYRMREHRELASRLAQLTLALCRSIPIVYMAAGLLGQALRHRPREGCGAQQCHHVAEGADRFMTTFRC